MTYDITDAELAESIERAHQGDGRAMDTMIHGLVERRRYGDAELQVEQLAAKGFTEAGEMLAFDLYDTGEPLENGNKWLGLMVKHALSGRPRYADSCFEIGERLSGQNSQLTGESLKWYHRAAEGLHEEAAIVLGYAYVQGEGVKTDVLEGLRWFMRSLSANVADSNSGSAKWPVDPQEGAWRDWAFFGELLEHLYVDQRIEAVRIVSRKVIRLKREPSTGGDDVAP